MSTCSRAISTPFGDFTITATADGVRAVAFGSLPLSDEMGAADTGAVAGAEARSDTGAMAVLDQAAGQLVQYFSGQRRVFTVPLDMPDMPPFQSRALAAMQRIGYGDTATYAQLAAEAGNPKAARAAGSACANNPIPIIIPCHRVVPTSGGTGNYGGGAQLKERLLHFEGQAN
ncbi:methylated-DNA--[protein]-cysteine S-methyltransferase [Corynebacterium ulceribovis]|uniref:methylated-DNA--[protein]-cysteine S-methyltransferase n=1 Tax=Corynebacterium ulceribovis TaxID=487732 RepID=UPI00037FAAFF|nr:methylated-DNA--[protein]-cysteine S-methyltransferase [Corynebacterium ulceribovis]